MYHPIQGDAQGTGNSTILKWEKELPKIEFDPHFKVIPNQSARRALFEHYVRTRAEEERKVKRAVQNAALEGFKQILEEAKEDLDHNTDYQTFKKRWGEDPRFQALDRKDRENLLNERMKMEILLCRNVFSNSRQFRT